MPKFPACCFFLLFVALWGGLTSSVVAEEPPADIEQKQRSLQAAENEAVREHIRNFAGRGATGDFSIPALEPAEAEKKFVTPDDVTVKVVLSEPEVRQPVCVNFDERGRMWVVQYLQYPFPAGLKVVKYDEHLRAVFDKVPPAPPNHDRGADKITIHEDTNGDGTFDKQKTFVDGLNIVTSALPGRGGVWVMNPPYLLFYPDADQDDVPDGDPEVHLAGFGMADTHAVANSLTWGPDGWLYGAQGSTCWASVTLPRIAPQPPVHFKGQAIWRYHPEKNQFEVFAEGGGNTFAVEFDAQGRVYSGHNGGNTRGFHYVQGGYYSKSWGKHGALTNPHAYGYFSQMGHAAAERFSHTLVKYESDALPPRYSGRLIAPVPLHNYVAVSKMSPDGSTWKTEDELKAIETDDVWFRPVDIKVGPDGCVYIADWCDTRLTHVDPRDTWNRARGRIWRLQPNAYPQQQPFDLRKFSTAELIETLKSPNKLLRQLTQRMIYEHGDADQAASLIEKLPQTTGQLALEYLWAIHGLKQYDQQAAAIALRHADPYVRVWGVRLLTPELAETFADDLYRLAEQETNVEVCSQLASTAKRIPGVIGYETAARLATRDDLADDPHIPLLTWWAIEAHANDSSLAAGKIVKKLQATKIGGDIVLPRLAQRLAAEPTEPHLLELAELLNETDVPQLRGRMLTAIDTAFAGRKIEGMPPQLRDAIVASASGDSPQQMALLVRAGQKEAEAAAIALIEDETAKLDQRIKLAQLLGQVGSNEARDALLRLSMTAASAQVRMAAIGGLRQFDSPEIAAALVGRYSKEKELVRAAIIDLAAGRAASAHHLIDAIEQEQIPRSAVAVDLVENLKLHGDESLNERIAKLWGATRATPDELAQQMEQTATILRTGQGDAAHGAALFKKQCATCHKLHGDGAAIGPDLTGYERKNLDYMLLSIVDPSAAIREEYTNFRVLLVDGRVLSGFVREQDDNTITLQNAENPKLVIPRDEIDAGPLAVDKSLMPDRLLGEMTATQIRDLFAYLQSDAAP
ncbi:PVC-type heme-binding CxxCH protein [Blastopirellula marina]|uniref:L-sorbosone dehydrogenase-like protein n=1 Tax=Blastopirellula marina DSM 3645 TaxID=314230 RepID=A3ZRW8_9BACT|nr:PVC-type heme-binding CxxCH protein [Blastopirellula marina]EAQ80887.1 L-sorbosone dehydrogenase-like protein [Blastopirellula marina DSM 3645]